jgi:autotransporter-associated beta strand protein
MSRILKICFLIAAGLVTALPLFARTDCAWTPVGSSTDYCDPNNWVPQPTDPLVGYGLVVGAGTPAAEINSSPTYNTQFIYVHGGTVNQHAGDVTVSPYMYIDEEGSYNMDGGTFFCPAQGDYYSIGRETPGHLNVSGGSYSVTPNGYAESMVVGLFNTPGSSVTVSNTGTIDNLGGCTSLLNGCTINIGTQSTSGLSGGTYKAWAILSGFWFYGISGAAGTVNFDGGTLVCQGDTTLLIDAAECNLLAGGGTIDTGAGFPGLQVPTPIHGSGGLTKKGADKLALAAANDYTGPTVVESGTLALEASARYAGRIGAIGSSTLIDAKEAATLDVTAVSPWTLGGTTAQTLKGNGTVVGAVVAAAGSQIEPGESIGTLTVTGDLAVGGSWDVEYDGGAAQPIDMLAVSGTLDLNGGTIDFALADGGSPLTAPAYVFASYGTLVPFTTPPVEQNVPAPYQVDYAYGPGANQIALVIPEPSTLVLLAMGLLGAAVCLRRRR